jgi:hypothetical protein
MINRLAIALFVMTTLFPISAYSEELSTAGKKPPYLKNINFDVQLKNNGWIKILEENAYSMTPEQYYEYLTDDKSKIAQYSRNHREISKHLNQDENFRIIYVKIQFLNYCKASVDKDDVAKYQKEWEDMVDKLPSINDKRPYKPTKEYDVIGMLDANTARFRCNYRTTLMTSFYSSTGEEIKTEKSIPIAKWETDKKRKEEMVPGETMTIPITVPDKALYWYVWVPK